MESLQTGNTLLKDDVNIVRSHNAHLQAEVDELRAHNQEITSQHSKQLQVLVNVYTY